jgi:hypothetical protein
VRAGELAHLIQEEHSPMAQCLGMTLEGSALAIGS